ncbi:hypothetical protein [Streptomyces litchfieldiae]|uniref:Uncharacterized protein n=1 Tax=Streptomyces litchfieldiae TaxID=3075543 RepID=A0ABU2MW64_9ACTN|nr:hypothetical protein [Streptomyces sp. DSM 44938]MDT0345890.1 hypothetical protein [Streptomyces sp. DSM 44938]
MSLTVPDSGAELATISVGYRSVGAGEGDLGARNFMSVSPLADGMRTAQIGELAPGWDFSAYARAVLHSDGREYHPLDRREGSFYTGLQREVPCRSSPGSTWPRARPCPTAPASSW